MKSGMSHIAFAYLAVLTFSQPSSIRAETSPRDTFLEFAKSAGEKDLARFKSFYSESFLKQGDRFPPETRDKFFLSYISALPPKPLIISEEQNGDKYTVRGEGRALLGESSGYTVLSKENGEWKVMESFWDFKPGPNSPVKKGPIKSKIFNEPTIMVKIQKTGEPAKNAGFIYVGNSGIGAAEKMVAITYGGSWTLSDPSGRAGLYDKRIASGNIAEDGTLQDWPKDTLRDKYIWTAGAIKVFANKTEIK